MPEHPVSARPRRRRDAAATRAAILEAATRRFATQGYGPAGVREKECSQAQKWYSPMVFPSVCSNPSAILGVPEGRYRLP